MLSYRRGVDGKLFVRSIGDRGVDGKVVVSSIGGREVGESGDADGWRLGDGGDGRFWNCFWDWGGDQFREWKGQGDLRFGVSIRKSEGCGDWSCGGIVLVHRGRS